MGSIFPEDDTDGLIYRVELWAENEKIDRVIARCSSIDAAHAAVTWAIGQFPGKRITLRHRTKVLDGSEQRSRNGR